MRFHFKYPITTSLIILAAGIFSIISYEEFSRSGQKPKDHSAQMIFAKSFSDEEMLNILTALGSSSPAKGRIAINNILITHDQRFIPVLIEMLRISQLGLKENTNEMLLVTGLRQLSGENLGYDWQAWLNWHQTSGIPSIPDSFQWKEKLHGL